MQFFLQYVKFKFVSLEDTKGICALQHPYDKWEAIILILGYSY